MQWCSVSVLSVNDLELSVLQGVALEQRALGPERRGETLTPGLRQQWAAEAAYWFLSHSLTFIWLNASHLLCRFAFGIRPATLPNKSHNAVLGMKFISRFHAVLDSVLGIKTNIHVCSDEGSRWHGVFYRWAFSSWREFCGTQSDVTHRKLLLLWVLLTMAKTQDITQVCRLYYEFQITIHSKLDVVFPAARMKGILVMKINLKFFFARSHFHSHVLILVLCSTRKPHDWQWSYNQSRCWHLWGLVNGKDTPVWTHHSGLLITVTVVSVHMNKVKSLSRFRQ